MGTNANTNQRNHLLECIYWAFFPMQENTAGTCQEVGFGCKHVLIKDGLSYCYKDCIFVYFSLSPVKTSSLIFLISQAKCLAASLKKQRKS